LAIKRIRVKYTRTSVWSEGSVYRAIKVPFKEGQVLWEKSYPRTARIDDIWRDIRVNMIGRFFDIFYPAVVEQTFASPTKKPGYKFLSPVWVTPHIYYKQKRLPEFYEWNPEVGKWHMTKEGYFTRTTTLGGRMEIGVAESPYEDMYDFTLLLDLQRRFPGETKEIVLFVYPDRYDEIVRAMFVLEVTFW
jgi:hypothetical protein